jgi:hypothetical protein
MLAAALEEKDYLETIPACSRPIVDAGWLPKDRQVGSCIPGVYHEYVVNGV